MYLHLDVIVYFGIIIKGHLQMIVWYFVACFFPSTLKNDFNSIHIHVQSTCISYCKYLSLSILGISKLYDLVKNLVVQKGRMLIRIRLDF